METFIIMVWTFSFLVGFLVLKWLRIDYVSNYSVFFAFSFLYTVIPLLMLYDIYPSTVWALSLCNDSKLVYTHLFVTSLANLSYSFGVSLFFNKKTPIEGYNINNYGKSKRNISWLDGFIVTLYFIISALVLVGGWKYKWGMEERGQIINSLLGQGKVIASGIYIYILVFYGFRTISIMMYFAILLVTLIEASRTTLIAMTIGTLILAREERRISVWKTGLIAFGFFCLIVLLAFQRIGMEVNWTNIFDLLYPVYIEGEYGAYMNLQTYHLFDKGQYDLTYFSNYLIDPICYMLPRPILELLSVKKDSLTIFGNWILSANPNLAEKYSPYGGFFYVAEASVAMPYIGPAIISFLFAWTYSWFEKRKNNTYGKLNYLIFTIGFNLVFIKHQFSGSSHFFITTLLSVYLIVYSKKILEKISN